MMKMEYMYKFVKKLKPVIAMVVAEVVFAGLVILYRLATEDGMNVRVLVAYRLLFAAAFTIPLALIVERNKRPKLTWMVLFQAFLSGLFGSWLSQTLLIESIAFSTATIASAIGNLGPGITFILAILFRMEKLELRRPAGKAKMLGTTVGIGGAMLLTFYRGVELNIWSTHVNLLHHKHQNGGHDASSHHITSPNYVLGSFFAIANCFTFSFWLIIQAKMSKTYPAPYSSTALMCAMGSIQSVIFALCTERDWKQWKLGWNIGLLTAAYGGIMISGFVFVIMSWCVNERGPLFVAIFGPLILVVVAIASSLVLQEKFHLGSLLGAVLIVGGLYMVLWGKSKELKEVTPLMPTESLKESGSLENNDSNNKSEHRSMTNTNASVEV